MSDPDRVFDWLGLAGSVPYYLIPLNLVWSDDGVEHDLQHFGRVARKLDADMDYWRELFHRDAWREHLVAVICAMVLRSTNFRREMQAAIARGSFVVPQLCVALAFLHGHEAREWIRSASMTERDTRQFKTLGALGRVSQWLEIPFDAPTDFETQHAEDDYSVGVSVASTHLAFWQGRGYDQQTPNKME